MYQISSYTARHLTEVRDALTSFQGANLKIKGSVVFKNNEAAISFASPLQYSSPNVVELRGIHVGVFDWAELPMTSIEDISRCDAWQHVNIDGFIISIDTVYKTQQGRYGVSLSLGNNRAYSIEVSIFKASAVSFSDLSSGAGVHVLGAKVDTSRQRLLCAETSLVISTGLSHRVPASFQNVEW